ncbi:MAG: PAS domain-containing protein [Rhodobacteraceae bacterium]|nr:PAS domain-containing protein [Paracoccaceae bacterium]
MNKGPGRKGDGKIVTMNGFSTDRRATPIRQVEAYWAALRPAGGVPRRAQVDPRGLENLLSHAFILERIAPGFARFRIAGSLFTDLAGMEVRGMPLSSMFTVEARSEIGNVLEHVFATPAIAEMHMQAQTGFGKPALEAQMIFLPLESDLGDVSRILGALVVRGNVGRSPRKFDLTGIDLRNLDGRAARAPEAVPDRAGTDAQPQRQTGFAEDQSRFAPHPKAPHLRLVKPTDD